MSFNHMSKDRITDQVTLVLLPFSLPGLRTIGQREERTYPSTVSPGQVYSSYHHDHDGYG